ncbi:uncharacterized protein LOC110676282 [Aedes aegypti]|uniref:Tc1-like transposase DDE domain-containing protein n=1 Tax=Aedes aegypti TaxID=7159 RepID=A0A6I8U6C4_AEDAE|nr:uncharacterized protein LOC110676282 [Aedes aegypti]
MSNVIISNIQRKHASPNTVYHALYGHYFLGISRKDLALIYGKALSTICKWISKYEEHGYFTRKQRDQVYKKFGSVMRQWVIDLYRKEPVLFLEEAKHKFQLHFHQTISVSSIWVILHEAGFSWKSIERRAIQIRDDEIIRFVKELLSIQWDLYNLVFLDEVAFDNRDMLRNKGYGVVGQKIIYRGEFCRKPRVSFLCFLGLNGIVESFWTEGTFNRTKFFDCCRKFALTNPHVQQYPGFHSVWIMDGAKIHCDPNIIRYLRSIGIIPIFLPPYCPFFNPIEVVFGLMKQFLRKHHHENSPILRDVCGTVDRFKTFSTKHIFEHCGYFGGGVFLPEKGLGQDPKDMDFNIMPY